MPTTGLEPAPTTSWNSVILSVCVSDPSDVLFPSSPSPRELCKSNTNNEKPSRNMTNVIGYFREWRKKWTDPPLAQSQRLEKIYSRFMEPSTPAISHVSSLPNVPSHSSLPNDTPPLTWKVINAASHSMQLEAIIADLDSKPWERVSELPPKQAQAVMDELQRVSAISHRSH